MAKIDWLFELYEIQPIGKKASATHRQKDSTKTNATSWNYKYIYLIGRSAVCISMLKIDVCPPWSITIVRAATTNHFMAIVYIQNPKYYIHMQYIIYTYNILDFDNDAQIVEVWLSGTSLITLLVYQLPMSIVYRNNN